MAKNTALGAEKSKKRTPPKPYSEDTLLSAMETAGNQEFDEETEKKGLGTPATRASIIEKLVSSGYAVRKGKQLCGVSYAGGGRWQGCFPPGVPEEEKIKPSRKGYGKVRLKREESLPLRWRSSRFWHIGNGALSPGFLLSRKKQDNF